MSVSMLRPMYVRMRRLHCVHIAEGVANYKGVPFMTSKGPVTAIISNATVA